MPHETVLRASASADPASAIRQRLAGPEHLKRPVGAPGVLIVLGPEFNPHDTDGSGSNRIVSQRDDVRLVIDSDHIAEHAAAGGHGFGSQICQRPHPLHCRCSCVSAIMSAHSEWAT
jgi:hypothetical protein